LREQGNGEVARVPKVKLDEQGQNVHKGARLIRDKDGWRITRDAAEKHNTKERLEVGGDN